MASTDQRLVGCFVSVFPGLDEEQVRRASHSSLAAWDSLATVTLVAVVEEEFSVSIATEDLQFMVSFDLVLDAVERALTNAG